MLVLLFRFLLSALFGYLIFAAVGWAVPPALGPNITASDAAAALNFSFADAVPEARSWHAPAGNVSQGWIVRRAYIHGRLGSESGLRYSEQVLKIGWPFTVARGFIRTVGSGVHTEGACFVGKTPSAQPVRMLPTQPVWPGIIFLGLVGLLASTLWSKTVGHKPTTATR
jgi:hypothetical protein